MEFVNKTSLVLAITYICWVLTFLQKHTRTLLIGVLLIFSTIGLIVYKDALEKASDNPNYEFYFRLFQVFFILTIAYVVCSWFFGKIKEYRQLKNERTEAELALLKSKIDPHFFFNTLNNLYSLAIKKSDDTPKMILKLSEIMRYTIYEGEHEFVTLEQEITYLEQYIEIHKIRYQKSVTIDFNRNIEQTNLPIAPLLFIMLLENAFKHGVESLAKDAFIKINLDATAKHIAFTVENNFNPRKEPTQGIGLENLKRRLSMIYPNQHQLKLESNDGIYSAHLSIQTT